MRRSTLSGVSPKQLHRAPLAAEIDRSNQFPMHLWKEMGTLGILGVTADETYGGAGMGYLAHVLLWKN